MWPLWLERHVKICWGFRYLQVSTAQRFGCKMANCMSIRCPTAVLKTWSLGLRFSAALLVFVFQWERLKPFQNRQNLGRNGPNTRQVTRSSQGAPGCYEPKGGCVPPEFNARRNHFLWPSVKGANKRSHFLYGNTRCWTSSYFGTEQGAFKLWMLW